MKLWKIGIVLMLMLFSAGIASATVSYDAFNRIVTVTSETDITLTEIDTALGNTDALWKDGEIWYCNGTIRAISSSIIIDDTDGDELRLMGNRLSAVQLYSDDNNGNFSIANFTIASWDNSSMEYSGGLGDNRLYDANLNNVTFRNATVVIYSISAAGVKDIHGIGTRYISISGASGGNVQNIDIEQATTSTSEYAFYAEDSQDLIVDNIYVNGTYSVSSCIGFLNCTNVTGRNFTAYNAGDYLTNLYPQTGSYGFVASAGSNNDFRNIDINGSKWSGFAPTGSEQYSYFENVTIRNAGHNGLDAHPCQHNRFVDIDVNGSVAIDILFTSGYATSAAIENNTVDGFTCGGIVVDQNNTDTTFLNGTLTGTFATWAQVPVNDSQIVTVHNVSGSGEINAWLVSTTDPDYACQRMIVTDSELSSVGKFLTDDTFFPGIAIFGNVLASTSATYNYNLIRGGYANLTVVDGDGNPVEGAKITFDRTVYNADGYEQSNFTTDENGKLFDNWNYTNWAIIPTISFDELRVETEYNSINITATKSEVSNSTELLSTGIEYSSDPSSIEGTSVMLVLENQVPIAVFSANVTSGAAPLSVAFTDTSTGTNITDWYWNFDNDGEIDSTEQNPIYNYTETGIYTVNLTVGNDVGNDSEVKENYITVTDGTLPISAFTGTPTSGTVPLTVVFTDASINATSWLWDFGDGNTSEEQNPTNIYNSTGTYTVNLTVTNEYGNSSEEKENYITVSEYVAPTEESIWGDYGSDLAKTSVALIGTCVVIICSAFVISALKGGIELDKVIFGTVGLVLIMLLVYMIYGVCTLVDEAMSFI